MNTTAHSDKRFDTFWVLTPLVILAFMLAQFRQADALASVTSGYGLLVLGLAVMVLGGHWAGRVGGRFLIKPHLTTIMLVGPGLAGALAIMLLPSAAQATPNEIYQGLFILFILALLVFSLVRLLLTDWLGRRDGTPSPPKFRLGAWRDYLMMTKMGLNGLVLVTTFVGFYMAAPERLDVGLCLRTLIGTALVAAGASVLNQFMERQHDGRMARTAQRPLPTGRLHPTAAFIFGLVLAIAGTLLLALTVQIQTAFLATLSLACYLFLYTPLKRINTLSTLAGAISGALPPVIGWTGAGGRLGFIALALFFILFLWQIPHFLAIAWKYREQYEAAGYPMYSVLDSRGRATGLQTLLYALTLLPISMMSSFQQRTGLLYLAGALLLGLAFVIFSLRFAWQPSKAHARSLFFASIAYLPLLLLIMVLDKVQG